MKKVLKIVGITIGSLLGLLLLAAVLIPVLFKDKLFLLAKNMANENLNAVVDFKKMDLSIFTNFPNMTVSMKDLSVVGIDKFKGDTLVSMASLDVAIDIMSYWKNEVVDIRSIAIESPRVYAKILPDSTVNWDITKVSTEEAAPVDTTGSSGLHLTIDKFTVNNGVVLYEDGSSNMLAALKNLTVSLKGDMVGSKSLLDVQASCDNFNVLYDGIMWISDASLAFNSKVEADLDKMLFTLNDADVYLNRIALQTNGSIQMKEEDILLNLTYGAKEASLKTLLEMVPSSVLPDVKNVTTKGELALSGWVKGVYSETSMPQVWAEMKVENGYIKYTALPQSIDNIHIDTKILYDGNNDANTKIDVNRFHFEVSGNPFDVTTNISTPMTDADIKATMKGKIDFASLSKALPLEGIDLAGIMTANVSFAGRMSAIEKEKYDQLNLVGTLGLQSFIAKTADLPLPLTIASAELDFTPQYLSLKSFSGKMGESDFQASGRLENFLNYALKDDQLKGNLQLTSSLINCNELMGSSTTAANTAADTVPLTVIVLPSNIDLSFNGKIGKILYDNLALTNASGGLGIKDGALLLNNLNAQFAGGTIGLSGNYKAVNTESAKLKMLMTLKDIQVKDLVNSFDMFDKVLPILSQVGGKMSMDFNFTNDLDKNMNPILMSMNAVGTVKADSLKLLNAESFGKITSLLGMKESSNVLKNVNASFTVKDGRIGIKPFPATIGTTHMTVGGQYGLDETIDAQIDMQIPAAKIAGAANDLIAQLGGGANKINATTLNVGVAIGGTTKNPTFKLAKTKYGVGGAGEAASPSLTDQAKEQAKELVEEKKEELKEKVKEEAAKQTESAVNKLKDMLKKK